jgi:hypothetical protein
MRFENLEEWVEHATESCTHILAGLRVGLANVGPDGGNYEAREHTFFVIPDQFEVTVTKVG